MTTTLPKEKELKITKTFKGITFKNFKELGKHYNRLFEDKNLK